MVSVQVVSEDKTGGGLELVIRKSTEHRRRASAKTALEWKHPFPARGADELLKRVRAAQEALFMRGKPDHLVFVMDLSECWHRLKMPAPHWPCTPDLLLDRVSEARRKMQEAARESSDGTIWPSIQDRLHFHLLQWERESILLPVAGELGLGPACPEHQSVRGAYAWLKARALERDQQFAKATNTRKALEKLSFNDELRERAVRAIPTLDAVVNELAEL